MPNTVEEGDILLRLQKPRHSLVLRAMPCCDQGRARHVGAKAHLGGVGIALEQKRLFHGTSGAEAGDYKKDQSSPDCHASGPAHERDADAHSEAASINDSIS
jgi:hypothetical protein